MALQDSKRFPRSIIGYNRSAVDSEFERLSMHAEQLSTERQALQSQVDTLTKERAEASREQILLSTQLSAATGQVVDLETSLSQAKTENDTLVRTIEAQRAEKNSMQLRFDQLRERDRDFAMREREFAELQSSVASIMSVTKRATDRLFQKAVENQESVIQIAGDAAREVATIRADMAQVREMLNHALDEVQDRIDRVDATLTGAVHKLVAIKHNDGLQTAGDQPTILSEVEQLLSMRPGDVDTSDGSSYSVPVLGPFSARFVADTAQRVADGRITPKREGAPTIRRANPSQFESSDDSILEASKLLERGGMTAQEFYSQNPQFVPDSMSGQQEEPASQPIQIGFTPEPVETDAEDAADTEESFAIPLGGGDDTMAYSTSTVGDYGFSNVGDTGYMGGYQRTQPVGYGGVSGCQYYPSRSYNFQPYSPQPAAAPAAKPAGSAVRMSAPTHTRKPAARRSASKKVAVREVRTLKSGR
ncbi:MAG: hypothetical protein E7559_10440 [Ruminococcaceae bacterium]|nr:hypothetical protein [Oscillospiraceae bacterium]